MVADKKECSGTETSSRFPFLADCAAHCNGTASMFAFGTNDYGIDRCDNEDCKCLCETSATVNGSCDQEDTNGFRLYKYVGQGNHFC